MDPRRMRQPHISPDREPTRAAALDPALLVERVRAGDAAAFEDLFRLTYDSLWRFAYGFVGSRAVAEELVQDVLLEVWTNRSTWSIRTSVKSYLYGAVRNRALNQQRRERMELRHEAMASAEGEAPAMAIPGTDIDDRLTDERRLKAIADAVRRLKEPRRTILTLRWDHGLTYAEVAAVLGITARAAETSGARAIAALKKELARLR
jgi:RNA polymerase sigma-70 factor (ECF subfamily)